MACTVGGPRHATPGLGLTVFKVELVEVHSLHQVPQSLGFKGGESRIANPPERTNKRSRGGEAACVRRRRDESAAEAWRASDSRVGIKVSVVDGLDQLLRYLDDLLFASCRDGTKT